MPPPPVQIARCETPFLGDPTLPPEIELVSIDPDGYVFTPIIEGGSVSLLQGPASGPLLFVGARVRNMHLCAIRIAGQLKDPVSEKIHFESRIVNFEPMNDGWGGPAPTDLSSVSNLQVCPNRWSMQDLFDKEYDLTVTVTDRDGRSVTQNTRVVPTCDEHSQEARCMCQCKQGYQLGESCANSSDAGP